MSDPNRDTPEAFMHRVLELARKKFPLVSSAPDESEFQLRFGESTINLFNFYKQYQLAPDRFEEIMLPALTTAVQLQELGPEQLSPPLDDVAERIMPLLYPASILKTQYPQLLRLPWIAGMDIAFVVDESRSYWFVSRELAAQWDQRPEELRTLALKNLDRHFLEHPVEFAFSEDASPRMIAPTEPNAYNSTRLLSEPFRGKLREMLGGDFALGMPSREFFVAMSLESSEAIAKVRRQVADDHARRDHPLCEHLLLVSADGISEYVEETGDNAE